MMLHLVRLTLSHYVLSTFVCCRRMFGGTGTEAGESKRHTCGSKTSGSIATMLKAVKARKITRHGRLSLSLFSRRSERATGRTQCGEDILYICHATVHVYTSDHFLKSTHFEVRSEHPSSYRVGA